MFNINRIRKIENLFFMILSESFIKKIKDPRLNLIQITDVVLSKDLSYAKIYFNCIKYDTSIKIVEKTLKKSTGFIRMLLARNTKLKYIPQLHFIYDNIPYKAYNLSLLIDKALEK